ncbi:hypothetical protein ShzoTeo12_54860 (plasmid) [Shinella zoogloeoides]|nr:hypothetical protein ShzoTeo12_54860 [Shinella zoogloeoides]
MRTLSNYRQEWFSNIRGDVLSGIVVALALIPEAIGFSVIAGVDPKVGLYASFAIACVAAFVGGRPGMISAATAATAVVMISLVKEHGLQYLFAATILMGIIQIVAGWLRLGRVMRFVSRSVITGFVNALAILIFMAQLPELIGVPTLTYVMIAGGLAIIYLFPYVTKATHAASEAIRKLLRRLDIKPVQGRVGARPYEFRHAFAVHRLTAWAQEGADIHAKLPWLSAYLGHQNVIGTEVYLKATPQLLELASTRFEQHMRHARQPR